MNDIVILSSVNYLNLDLSRMWYLKHSSYSFINTLHRIEKNSVGAVNWCVCGHICKLTDRGCLSFFLCISLLCHGKLSFMFSYRKIPSFWSFLSWKGKNPIIVSGNIMGAFSRGCSKHVNPISQTFVFCKVAKEQHAANLCTPILGDAVLRKMILGEFCFASSANPPISAEKADSRVAGKKTKPKQQLFSFFKL